LRNDENEAEKSGERAFKSEHVAEEDEAAIKALRAVGCF
jgi:hypothetical protein